MRLKNRLVTNEYTVRCANLPDAFEGMKILHLSDLHHRTFGNNNDRLVAACTKTKPDVFFFTGDLYSRAEEELDCKAKLMKRLVQIAPTYYILGNHEVETPEKAGPLTDKLISGGIHVLADNCERIYRGNDFVNIYGTKVEHKYYKNADGGYKDLPKLTVGDMNNMLGDSDGEHFNILLSHTPFPFATYAKWGADLIFSGHCHGGIIRLPFIGGVLSPERRFFPKYTKGIYKKNVSGKSSQMVVSAGLGKFRLFNPAEIVLVTLERND